MSWGTGVYDSDTLAEIDYIPKKMVVQGGGIIGLEYANIFAKMGTKAGDAPMHRCTMTWEKLGF